MIPEVASKRALARILRYVVVPAVLVGLDSIRTYLEAGSLAIDWKVVFIVMITAGLAGASKWLRDILELDLRVI